MRKKKEKKHRVIDRFLGTYSNLLQWVIKYDKSQITSIS